MDHATAAAHAQLLRDAGITVTSPSLALVSYHVQSVDDGERGRIARAVIGYSSETQVPGDIATVLLTDRWLFA